MSIKEHLKGRLKFNLDLINFNIKSIDMILRFNEIREKANEEYKKNIKNNIENFLENK